MKHIISYFPLFFFIFSNICNGIELGIPPRFEQVFKNIQEQKSDTLTNAGANGTIWAVIVAGSNGYYNYRHQVFKFSFSPSYSRLN